MELRTNLTDAQRRAHEILDEVRAGQFQPYAEIEWALRQLGDLPGRYVVHATRYGSKYATVAA